MELSCTARGGNPLATLQWLKVRAEAAWRWGEGWGQALAPSWPRPVCVSERPARVHSVGHRTCSGGSPQPLSDDREAGRPWARLSCEAYNSVSGDQERGVRAARSPVSPWCQLPICCQSVPQGPSVLCPQTMPVRCQRPHHLSPVSCLSGLICEASSPA